MVLMKKQSAELSIEVGNWELYCEIEHVKHNMAIALSYYLWNNATANSMNWPIYLYNKPVRIPWLDSIILSKIKMYAFFLYFF